MDLGRLLRLAGGRCQACGEAVCAQEPPQGAPAGLCSRCRAALQPRRAGYCPGCGALYADTEVAPYLCGECRVRPRPWANLHFYGPYEGLLRDLILGYKLKGRTGVGRLLQGLALDTFSLAASPPPVPDVIVPVPLHPRRLAKRGFNQSLELARPLGRALSRPVSSQALRRVRSTVPQMDLPAKDRLHNVRGAFVAHAPQVRGAGVLLVDDIMTTGGTLTECTRTLQRAGAVHVDVLVIARTA